MGWMSRKVECALLAAACLAARHEAGEPVCAAEIARHTGLPRKYLNSVLLSLKRRMLVRSERGPRGGYRLMRRPELIGVGEVMEAAGVRDPAGPGLCVPGAYRQALNWLLERMVESRRAALREITLADLARIAGRSEGQELGSR